MSVNITSYNTSLHRFAHHFGCKYCTHRITLGASMRPTIQDHIGIHITLGANIGHKMQDYIDIHITLNADTGHKMADAIGIRITLDANMDAKCQIPSGSVSFSCPISVVCSLSGRRRYVVGGIGEPECV